MSENVQDDVQRRLSASIIKGDLGVEGASEADVLLFDAAIAGKQGEFGTPTGLLITADVPDEASDDTHQDRLSHLSFDLGEGTSLVASEEEILRL